MTAAASVMGRIALHFGQGLGAAAVRIALAALILVAAAMVAPVLAGSGYAPAATHRDYEKAAGGRAAPYKAAEPGVSAGLPAVPSDRQPDRRR